MIKEMGDAEGGSWVAVRPGRGRPLKGAVPFLDFKSCSDRSDCEPVELPAPRTFEESTELGLGVHENRPIRVF